MRFLAVPVLFVAVGCGSDGTKKPMLLDSKVFLDAGADAAPVCGVKTMFGGLTLGTAAAPTMPSDWFDVPTMGPNVGKTILSIGANLPDSTATMRDVFILEYVKPAGGFTLGTAVPFNPDPNATYVAAAFLFSDVDSTGMTYNNFYYASTGSVTLSAVSETDGGLTTGSMAATNMREVDDMTGADIAGGCATTFAGLSFNLKQMNAPFTQTDAQIQTAAGGGADVRLQNLAKRIARFHEEQAQAAE